MSKKKDKPVVSEHDNGFRGVSPFGAAIFAPGRHPKDRQLADKKAAEEGVVTPAEPEVEVPVSEETVAAEPVEEAAEAPVVPEEE